MSQPQEPKVEWCKLYLVLVGLCVCYFGKYFCTSDMYVVQAQFTDTQGISAKQLSSMFAMGYFMSMFGKVAAGGLCDAIGGRFVVLMAAGGYALCSVLFSLVPDSDNSFWMFLVLWGGIGFFALGLAWVSIVSVATNWIPKAYLGRLMGFVSMAPQLGDATARLCLAPFLDFGWRAVFQASAAVACGVTLPVLLFIGNKPASAAASEAAAPAAATAAPAATKPKGSYFSNLKVLLANPFLWVLCLLSGSLYGTRTLFLLYSTSFLSAAYCKDAASIAACHRSGHTMRATSMASSSYTLLGCVSVLLVGFLKDRLPARHRGATLTLFVAPLFIILAFLAASGPDLPFGLAAAMVALIGFCLFGPYKVLGAVFAVDVGGKELKSTCTAFMGVFDNLFAMLMLFGKGAIGEDWSTMFSALTILSSVSLLCAATVWVSDLRAHKRATARELAGPSAPLLLA